MTHKNRKKLINFICIFSSSSFGHQNPGSGLYPDLLDMVDPDPDSMNPDPQLITTIKFLGILLLPTVLRIRVRMDLYHLGNRIRITRFAAKSKLRSFGGSTWICGGDSDPRRSVWLPISLVYYYYLPVKYLLINWYLYEYII